jgi:hypothetical protein
VTTAVLGDRTWPAFKLDLFRRRRATTIVVGTSRIWKIGSRRGEQHFANVGLPGMSVDSVPILFRRLHELAPHTRLTIYLGLEPFWFTTPDRSSSFARASPVERAKLLASGETLRATLTRLTHDPGQLISPLSRRAPRLESTAVGCVYDERSALPKDQTNAWTMDGRFVYAYELTGAIPTREDFLSADISKFRGSTLAPASVADIRAALAFARTVHWRVVGFTAPFSHNTIQRLERDPGGRRLLAVYRRGMPALFASRSFPYADLLDGPTVKCTDDEFLRHDGAHADSTCAAKVRRRLDAVSAAMR